MKSNNKLNINNEPPLVVSYIRWSSGKQKLGDSERRQLETAQEWLDENGYTVDKDYVLTDDGKSGYYSENFGEDGALGKFIIQVKAGKIPKGTILIIEDFSRFSRAQVSVAQQRFLELINNDIRIYIVKDKKEYNKKDHDLVNMIVSLAKMTSAHEESERKSLHLTQFWQEARKKAANSDCNDYPVLLPSNAPDWLRKVKRNGQKFFEIIPERREIINKIFKLADEGGMDGLGLGSTMIVRVLESEGIKPFKGERTNTAVTFNDSYVLRLLKDTRLLGFLQPHKNPIDENTGKRRHIPSGDLISDYFPPVVSKELFDRVEDKIKQRRVYSGATVSRNFSNLFTKLGKCSKCGNSMTLFTKRGSKKEGGKSAYLQCSEGTKHKKCGNRAVRYFDTFEKSIIHTLNEMNLSSLFSQDNQTQNTLLSGYREQKVKAESELIDINQELKNATKLIVKFPDDEDFIEAKHEIKHNQSLTISKIDELEQKIARSRNNNNYDKFKSNLQVVIDSLDADEELESHFKRKAINTYLIDIIQYIAIDGVKQEAWIVLDHNYLKNEIRQGFARGKEIINLPELERIKASSEVTIPTEEEIDVFGLGFAPHIKIKLRRFDDCTPSRQDLLEMRTTYEIAPKELIKINKTCDSAINKNWKSKKRLTYTVLDDEASSKLRDAVYEEFYVPPPDDYEPDEEWLNAPTTQYENGDIVPLPSEIYKQMYEQMKK